jgi:dolichyl-diphosphooligosaccharide--protein glycosyltransferase
MSPRKRNCWLLIAALALALALRLGTYDQVHTPHGTIPISADCLYHLRRARFAVEHFPRTVVLDPLINFPAGGICIWPPLFDAALALPSLLGKGPQAAPDVVVGAAAWVPLFFAAGAIAAAGLAGIVISPRWGVFAAFFVALCPGHLRYSQFGHTDQHVAESCWGFLTLALFLRSCGRNSKAADVLTGISLALCVLTWQGAIFWAPLLGGALLAESIGGEPHRTLRRAAAILGLPAALSAAGTAFWLSGFSLPFTYVSFGWFQPVFLAGAFAATLLLATAAQARRGPRGALAFNLGVGLAALVPVLIAGHKFLEALGGGLSHLTSGSEGSPIVEGGFLSYPKEWLRQISEYQPLLSGGWGWPLELLSLAFFLSPAAILLWGIRALRGTRRGTSSALFLWGAFTLFFTLTQRRNMYYAALLSALAALDISAAFARRVSRKPGQRNFAFLGVALVMTLPMFFGLAREFRARYGFGNDLLATLERLKQMAPQEVNPYDPRFLAPGAPVPELGRAESVMAPWSLGHALTYFGERPVVADNFGYGFFDSVRFFLAESENEALAIARVRRCRFVVAADLSPKMNDYGHLLGRPDYLARSPRGTVWTARYFATIQARLYDFDASGGRLPDGSTVASLPRFRLRFSSATGEKRFGRFVSRWKIFEIAQNETPE